MYITSFILNRLYISAWKPRCLSYNTVYEVLTFMCEFYDAVKLILPDSLYGETNYFT